MRPLIFALPLCAVLSTPVLAAPQTYALDAGGSSVGFTWDFGADQITGQMSVARADLAIDFDNLAASQVDVAVNVAGAEAGFPFATEAMLGPKVLDAAQFPQITFTSTAVNPNGTQAVIEGQITVHGVTRPMAFQAEIYRQTGTEAGDMSQLLILLTGALNRSDFGADGWSDMVGDRIALRILASIAVVN